MCSRPLEPCPRGGPDAEGAGTRAESPAAARGQHVEPDAAGGRAEAALGNWDVREQWRTRFGKVKFSAAEAALLARRGGGGAQAWPRPCARPQPCHSRAAPGGGAQTPEPAGGSGLSEPARPSSVRPSQGARQREASGRLGEQAVAWLRRRPKSVEVMSGVAGRGGGKVRELGVRRWQKMNR